MANKSPSKNLRRNKKLATNICSVCDRQAIPSLTSKERLKIERKYDQFCRKMGQRYDKLRKNRNINGINHMQSYST